MVRRQEEALSLARSGLLRISNIDPIVYKPDNAGGTLGIVGAFRAAQQIAEDTLLKVSDLEADDGDSE